MNYNNILKIKKMLKKGEYDIINNYQAIIIMLSNGDDIILCVDTDNNFIGVYKNVYLNNYIDLSLKDVCQILY